MVNILKCWVESDKWIIWCLDKIVNKVEVYVDEYGKLSDVDL